MRLFWLALFPLTACGGGSLGVSQSPIINGHPESGRPNVAELFISTGPTSTAACTATLIGTRTLLTSAHCVVDRSDAPIAEFPGLGVTAGAKRVDVLSGYDNSQIVQAAALDLAIIALDRDIAAEPARVATAAPWVGQPVHLVGYGLSANNADDYGTLRAGDNSIADIQPGYYRVDDTDAAHATTCHGDSGGPQMVVAGGIEYLAGVTSRGTCEDQWLWGLWDRTVAFATRADSQLTFITQAAAGNLYDGDGHYEKDPPTVTLSAPREVATGALLPLAIEAADDVRVVAVDVLVDGRVVAEQDFDAPRVTVSQTVTLTEGIHTVEAVARDGAGREARATQGFRVDTAGNATIADPPATTDPPPPAGTAPTAAMNGDETNKAKGCSIGGRTSEGLHLPLLAALALVAAVRRRARAGIRKRA
jgi:hypothetical protein